MPKPKKPIIEEIKKKKPNKNLWYGLAIGLLAAIVITLTTLIPYSEENPPQIKHTTETNTTQTNTTNIGDPNSLNNLIPGLDKLNNDIFKGTKILDFNLTTILFIAINIYIFKKLVFNRRYR